VVRMDEMNNGYIILAGNLKGRSHAGDPPFNTVI
jgi:hypothetical protein